MLPPRQGERGPSAFSTASRNRLPASTGVWSLRASAIWEPCPELDESTAPSSTPDSYRLRERGTALGSGAMAWLNSKQYDKYSFE